MLARIEIAAEKRRFILNRCLLGGFKSRFRVRHGTPRFKRRASHLLPLVGVPLSFCGKGTFESPLRDSVSFSFRETRSRFISRVSIQEMVRFRVRRSERSSDRGLLGLEQRSP